MFAALTDTPACSYEVVRDPGWPVTLVGTLPNAVVIARLLSAASGKFDRIRPDRRTGRDRRRRGPRERQRRVGAGVDGAVDRRRRADRHVRLIDRHRSVAELVREADPDLAAAQRDVDDLAQRQVAERRRRQVGRSRSVVARRSRFRPSGCRRRSRRRCRRTRRPRPWSCRRPRFRRPTSRRRSPGCLRPRSPRRRLRCFGSCRPRRPEAVPCPGPGQPARSETERCGTSEASSC